YDKRNRGRASERVFMPQSTFQKLYGSGRQINMIWLRPEPGVDGFELEGKVVELLKRRHDVAPQDNRGIRSFNMAMPAQIVNGLGAGITIFIWFVGPGTLPDGLVGISNILIMADKE